MVVQILSLSLTNNNKTMDRKELRNETIVEVTKLKEYVDDADLKKLANFLEDYSIEPHNQWECIYGAMYGHCHSVRAVNMIQKCCPMYYEDIPDFDCDNLDAFDTNKYSTIVYVGSNRKWSALELYISLYEDDIPIITDFLINKTQTLEL